MTLLSCDRYCGAEKMVNGGGDQVKGIFRISQIIFCTAGWSTDSNQLKPTSSIHGWSMGSLYDSHSLLCISLLHHHRLVVGIVVVVRIYGERATEHEHGMQKVSIAEKGGTSENWQRVQRLWDWPSPRCFTSQNNCASALANM